MKQLTFRGFLSSYIRKLSYSNCLNIFKLCEEAEKINPRLREPLFFYSLASEKTDILKRASKKYNFFDIYKNVFCMDQYSLYEDLENEKYPVDYQKVWESYKAEKNRHKTDNYTKELIRQKIIKLQKEKNISNYSIYKELKYNPGNFNDWIRNGSSNKVSLEAARKSLEYVKK